MRKKNTLLLVALVVGMTSAGMASYPSSARGYHTYKERLLDTTAYSLHRRRARLGLMQLSYGIIDQLQVTTYTLPWILGAIFQDVAPNVQLKSTFYNHKRLALSVSGGFLTGTVLQPDGRKIRYFLVPVSAAASVRINSYVSTHFGAQYTAVDGDAQNQPEGTAAEGALVVDFFQLWGMAEWRLSRVVAFTFTVRWVPYVSDLILDGTVDAGNPALRARVEADLSELRNAFAVIPGFVFSWDRANIRLGVGYNDFFVEGFFLVLPGALLSNVSFEFDVFVRF
ncbi:MAG: hypothetical protein KJO40_12935 [Deltaproteobacteria bacterium]|nr:hypothetical protein [Deltaproteobacteria bacterium]NND27679.1 hypothetical protein [Myxococcales bacterium]MBT8464723.1 hypothetical protein [Deltaproteobacteria bacterium]MBT8482627.1 hypothetical protein [Deltaproteobacteria bacterium]NNK08651.1 hypothetical protein [Myxococcales bacterium]